jgi:hypothetical protein
LKITEEEIAEMRITQQIVVDLCDHDVNSIWSAIPVGVPDVRVFTLAVPMRLDGVIKGARAFHLSPAEPTHHAIDLLLERAEELLLSEEIEQAYLGVKAFRFEESLYVFKVVLTDDGGVAVYPEVFSPGEAFPKGTKWLFLTKPCIIDEVGAKRR